MKQLLLSTLCAVAALSLLAATAQAQNAAGTGTTSTGNLSTGSLSTGALSTGTTSTGALGARSGPHNRGAMSPEKRAREIIARYDKDGDHALNAAELTAFFEAVQQRAAERRTQQASNNTSQPAHGSPQEHAARAIEKFDGNSDGKLEAGELAAMLIAFRERALQHQGQGQGQSQSQGRSPGQGQNRLAPATTTPAATDN